MSVAAAVAVGLVLGSGVVVLSLYAWAVWTIHRDVKRHR